MALVGVRVKNLFSVRTTGLLLGTTLPKNWIMTSSLSADKAVEQLKTNPYFDKYAEKIATLQKTLPEEFLARFGARNEVKRPKSQNERSYSLVSAPKPGAGASTSNLLTKQKTLDQVMKVELIQDKDPEEIEHIWLEYYKHKDAVTGVIPVKIYDLIWERTQHYPTFLFPLPRGQGYEFIVCQFSGHEAHFTPLINYQAHKENAPECLTIVHYSDLREKGIVLMCGEFNKDILNSQEAQCLANQLQLYYGHQDKRKLNLLDRFTNSPDEFKHMDLVAELECLSL